MHYINLRLTNVVRLNCMCVHLKSFESSSSQPVHITKWAVYFCATAEKDKFVSAVCDAFSQKVQVVSTFCTPYLMTYMFHLSNK